MCASEGCRRRARSRVAWARAAVAASALSLALVTGAPLASAQALDDRDASRIEAAVDTAPVEIDGQALFRVRGATSLPAATRAGNIARRIEAVAADPSVSTETVRAVESDGLTWIKAGDRPLLGITEADARFEQLTRAELAVAHVARIRRAIDDYRFARRSESLREHIRDTVLAGLAALLGVAVVLVVTRWSARLFSRIIQRRVSSVHLQSVSALRAGRVHAFARQTLYLAGGLVVLAIVFQYARFALGRFPATRYLANHLIALVIDPIHVIGSAALRQVPNLIFLAVLFLVFRIALKVFRLVFDALDHGALRVSGFEPDWALPTYKIVRFGWIAFGVVVAYPYLPGSQSEAFKGVSIFVGVLLSLGSTSAIANVIAGYLLIYRRAFRIGDRVKIGDMTGDVTESRLQVTRLKSLKNEEIVIPNSTILNSDVTNFTSLARTQGLILHTTVGIGYETPWRQVEAMLLLAAERTPGLLRSPAPFVLQRSLGDYAVNYELNVHTNRADLMLETYHELHRHILDVFNEYGVQIMTPSYMTDPAQPKIVAPSDWHLAPAKPTSSAGV